MEVCITGLHWARGGNGGGPDGDYAVVVGYLGGGAFAGDVLAPLFAPEVPSGGGGQRWCRDKGGEGPAGRQMGNKEGREDLLNVPGTSIITVSVD